MKNPSFPVPTGYAIHWHSERYFLNSLHLNRHLIFYEGKLEKKTSGGVGKQVTKREFSGKLALD